MTASTAKHDGQGCGAFREDVVGLRPLGSCAFAPDPNFGMVEVRGGLGRGRNTNRMHRRHPGGFLGGYCVRRKGRVYRCSVKEGPGAVLGGVLARSEEEVVGLQPLGRCAFAPDPNFGMVEVSGARVEPCGYGSMVVVVHLPYRTARVPVLPLPTNRPPLSFLLVSVPLGRLGGARGAPDCTARRQRPGGPRVRQLPAARGLQP